jgi:phytoene dehydrogenase-like protein
MKAEMYDAIVIGGGHNGLAAAAYLAKAGRSVLVVERRPVLGGAAATEAVFPGYRVNTGCWDAGLFLPEIVRDLSLEAHGLRFLESPAVLHTVQPGGQGLTLWREAQRSVQEIATFSANDARRYPQFVRHMAHLAEALRPVLTLSPPPLKSYRLNEVLAWLPAALKVKRLGKREMMELLRVLPMPAWDWLDEWFESPMLKAALGAAGTLGSMQGPKASGTAFLMLYHALGAGEAGFRASRAVQGGAGALSEALASAARQLGAEVHTGTPVRQILLEDGRVTGVELADGRRIASRAVLSSADPRTTFFGLLGAPHLDVRLVREVKNIKFRGSLARVNLALSGLPGSLAVNVERLGGRILVCPDLETLERAYDDAKYGSLSQQPCLDLAVPTLLDSSLAPPGQHLLTINVQYAPYHLKNGTWDDQREQLGDRVVETLARWMPGIEHCVLHRQVLTPLDLEREYSLPEGCIYHGQMGLDQLLFMRPVAGTRGSRTALENLYLCGAGAHPGGGLTGAPGYNAARQVIQDLKTRR